jgi:hypothetical protein
MDPYATQTDVDPARYTKVASLQIDGPDSAGDPITGVGIKVTTEDATALISGKNQKINFSVLIGGEVDFLVKFGAKAGVTFEWEYEDNLEKSTGTTQEAELTLRSSTVQYHRLINVYYDSVFGSFSYSTPPTLAHIASIVSGSVVDSLGVPLANQRVNVRLADGTNRIVFTNSHGLYRVLDTPANAKKVSIEYQGKTARIQGHGRHKKAVNFVGKI